MTSIFKCLCFSVSLPVKTLRIKFVTYGLIYIYIYIIFLWTSKGDQIIKYGRLWSNLKWCPRALLDLISPSCSWSLHYTKKWFVYQIKELKKIFIFLQNNTSLSYTDEDFFSISFLFFVLFFFWRHERYDFPHNMHLMFEEIHMFYDNLR